MGDKIIKGLLCDAAVNFYAITARNLAESARIMHGASPTCTAVLGRSLMAASMMGCMMKNAGDEVSLIFKGDGPAGNVVCVGRSDGSVKGYVAHPEVELPPRADGKLDVGGAVGRQGTLTVISDLGLKEPYIGQSELVSGEIAEDVASYYMNSQQQPSAVFLGVHMNQGGVTSASGIILQPMPFCPESVIGLLESRLDAVAEMPGLLEGGMPLEKVIDWLFSDMEPVITAELEPRLRCDCSRARLERVLLSLGREELQDMIDQQGGAELTCHFCNQKYHFDRQDLERLLEGAAQKPAGTGE